MEESTKKIAEGFRCSYTVFEQGTDPQFVERAYRKAFEAGKTGGFYPAVLCLDECAVEWLEEVVKQEYDREKIIAGCQNNGRELLEERFLEYTEEYGEEELEELLAPAARHELTDEGPMPEP